ncbi:MAG: hypothetical protein FJW34_02485 [Acidobacteria bacterium]|nr:hypothetical protein [Acidobacteriota bacterium]
MKHFLTVIAALLVMAGLAAAQATFTIVTGTETPIGLANPGEVKCHGGLPTGNPFAPCPPGTSGTVRGQQRILLEESSDARTNGLSYGIFNANIHKDGTLNVWGTFRLEVSEGGVWEGVWEGRQAADGSVSYSATGHGSGGRVEHLQLLLDGAYPAGSLVGTLRIRILTPGK